MPLEFRILGPLEASEEGRLLPLGGPKQRSLLALLLLHANEVVTSDRLLEKVWHDSRPDGAARSLQVYVSSLRKALGHSGTALQTRAGGYSIAIEPDQLDAVRFERLVDEGARMLANREPERAVMLLREALKLWRGPALADLGYLSFAQNEIARLEELRLAAVETRIEADFALGRGAELVGELESLAARHPLRERLHGQLMIALYRAGRQAEALEVFHTARDALVEELGLEPSPELREVQAAILRQDPALTVESPELRARRRLPAPATALIGRQAELDDVRTLFRDEEARLVTLTGPGGTGKTRLALQAAWELADRFPDGVHFVGLAPVRNPELVPAAIGAALGVREAANRTLFDGLNEHLRERQLLLLIDNFEQVDESAPLLAELLAAAPGLALLVTSRALLHLYGEHEYAVPPLALPEPDRVPDPARLEEYESIALFVARAQAVLRTFRVTQANAPALAEICQRLDGLPLAIELAAARAAELTPDEMLDVLPSGLELSTGGARDLAARQQTLRATIDWSYALVGEGERKLFGRLGVFAGGCTLEAAQVICGADLGELASLADANLLLEAEGAGGEPRLDVLETLREYALQRLEESGDAEEMRRRHASHFLAVAEQAEPGLDAGPDQSIWLERLALEHDNLRMALAWFAARHESQLELRLASALANFWWVRGHLSEGRKRLEDALARSEGVPTALRAKSLTALASLVYRQGAFEVARAAWEESLDLFRELGDSTGIARSLGELGSVAVGEGDYRRAASLYEESAALFRSAGDTMRLASVLGNLGAIANIQGNYERGRPLCEEALALHREVGATDDVALTLNNLARVALHEGRQGDAHELLEESLELAHELGYTELIAYSFEGFAELSAAQGDYERAAKLLGAGERLFEELNVAPQGDDRETYERTVQTLEDRLGERAFADARSQGRSLEQEVAIEYARGNRD
jgi:predicted ATPase/DNA-binding SARP family transcriptional activator